VHVIAYRGLPIWLFCYRLSVLLYKNCFPCCCHVNEHFVYSIQTKHRRQNGGERGGQESNACPPLPLITKVGPRMSM
jgi:hypothetical protein